MCCTLLQCSKIMTIYGSFNFLKVKGLDSAKKKLVLMVQWAPLPHEGHCYMCHHRSALHSLVLSLPPPQWLITLCLHSDDSLVVFNDNSAFSTTNYNHWLPPPPPFATIITSKLANFLSFSVAWILSRKSPRNRASNSHLIVEHLKPPQYEIRKLSTFWSLPWRSATHWTIQRTL